MNPAYVSHSDLGIKSSVYQNAKLCIPLGAIAIKILLLHGQNQVYAWAKVGFWLESCSKEAWAAQSSPGRLSHVTRDQFDPACVIKAINKFPLHQIMFLQVHCTARIVMVVIELCSGRGAKWLGAHSHTDNQIYKGFISMRIYTCSRVTCMHMHLYECVSSRNARLRMTRLIHAQDASHALLLLWLNRTHNSSKCCHNLCRDGAWHERTHTRAVRHASSPATLLIAQSANMFCPSPLMHLSQWWHDLMSVVLNSTAMVSFTHFMVITRGGGTQK